MKVHIKKNPEFEEFRFKILYYATGPKRQNVQSKFMSISLSISIGLKYVLETQRNHLIEMIILSSQNIYFN